MMEMAKTRYMWGVLKVPSKRGDTATINSSGERAIEIATDWPCIKGKKWQPVVTK